MEEKVFGGKIDIPTAAVIRRIVREEIKWAESRRTPRAADGDYCDCKQKHTQVNELGRLVCAFCHRPRR